MEKTLLVPYETYGSASLFDIKDINSSFAYGSLKVMYTGKNRNGSSFTRGDVQSALPSLRNVPIVCNYDYEENMIGAHDVELVSTDDGGFKLRNLTFPIGVVPESATFKFAVMDDPDGVKREYLVVNNLILWKRQDAYDHIVNDLGGKVNHSMEIRIKDGALDDDGVYQIKDFEFTALCLLESAEPCFQGSELEVFNLSEFKGQMEEMMSELKETLYTINTSEKEFDINDLSEEGGKNTLQEKMALLEELGISVESLDFSIDDYSVEELREKFVAENSEAEDSENNTVDTGDASFSEDTSTEDESAFELNCNIREFLNDAIIGETVHRSYGDERRYWLVDFDTDNNMIYVEDGFDGKLYGVPYVMDGDKANVDFACKKRMKYAFVEYDGGEQVLPTFSAIEEADRKYSEFEAEYSEKINELNNTINSLTEEVTELRNFKESTQAAQRELAENSERMNVLDQFADLAGVEAYDNIREHANEYDAETLEEKCYAIRGRNLSNAKFSFENKTPKFMVSQEEPEYKPYGGAVEYYESKRK